MNSCFQANILAVHAMSPLSQLKLLLGALADGLGSYPFADGY